MILKEQLLNIPTTESASDQWLQWHKDLKSKLGKKSANSLWLKAWLKRGASEANTLPLREYLKKNGLEISGSVWDDVIDKGSGFADVFGNMFQMGRYMGYAVAFIVIGGAGLMIFNIARKPIEAMKAGAKFTPAGRAAGVAGV